MTTNMSAQNLPFKYSSTLLDTYNQETCTSGLTMNGLSFTPRLVSNLAIHPNLK